MIGSSEIYWLAGASKDDCVSCLWRVFIDDSADERRQEHVIAGAIFGSKGEWHQFAKQWCKILHAKPRIEYYHEKEFVKCDGEFRKFRFPSMPRPDGKEAKNQKREALINVIRNSPLVAIGAGVRVPDYKYVRETHPRGKTFMSEDAYEWALQQVIVSGVAGVRRIQPEARIAFVSDDSNKAPRYTALYSECKQANPHFAKSMLGIAHLDDKDWPGLQAADMIAKSAKLAFDAHAKDGQVDLNIPLLSEFWRIPVLEENYMKMVLDAQPSRETRGSNE